MRKILITCLILIPFGIIKSQDLNPSDDSCKYKDLWYLQDENQKNVSEISDSVYFDKYILFRINLEESDSKTLSLDIFFANNLEEIFDIHKSFYFPTITLFLYAIEEKHSSADYGKIKNIGRDNPKDNSIQYFDRLNMGKVNASIFNGLTPWSYSLDSKYVYFIYKTEFSGYLFQNDIQRSYETGEYVTLNVLIPFISNLPLYKVEEKEIEMSHVVRRKNLELRICR